MDEKFIRTMMIYGEDAISLLKNKKVAIFGIGGVGGYVTEALARSGIGKFVLVDNDVVSLSNINRQIIATLDTVGQYKVDVMKKRILSINDEAQIEVKKCFFLDNEENFDFSSYDYIIDAIDTVSAKIKLAEIATRLNIPLISSMGTGNKINPMGFIITDINKTEMDPLAKVMRYELRKRGISKLKVCYSKEKPLVPLIKEVNEKTNKVTPGSSAFVPSSAGLLIASEVIKDLTLEYVREELKR